MRALHAAFAFGVGFVAVLASACVREGAPVVAPVEIAVANLGDAGPVPVVVGSPKPSSSNNRCSAALEVAPIKTGSGCTLDERVSAGSGLLRYPCQGDGAVEAVFKEHRFQGVVNDGNYLLDLTTEIDWEDGCHWETKQRIAGEWRREGRSTKLVWTYSEGPVSGTGCYGACKASADITVEANPEGAR